MTSFALWTTNGLNLVATAVQTAGVNAAITYVGLSTGCGTLSTPLVAGNTYTALSLTGTLPANLASGATLVITDGVNSQQVSTSASASAGATAISVAAFTASFNFAASVTGIAPLPQTTDITLYNESVRVKILANGAGAGAGETLASGYCDGTQPTNIYMMVGYFGGPSATGSTGTGTLMGEDVQFWNHTINTDSNMYQGDAII